MDTMAHQTNEADSVFANDASVKRRREPETIELASSNFSMRGPKTADAPTRK